MTTHDPDLDGEIENAVVDYIRMIADVTTQAGPGRPEERKLTARRLHDLGIEM
ncbi:hypothetical protein [Nocardia sp. NPDC057030]|uniref:hypothetical protein n=1 Tax=unclassified Nocardia TaxID=2637762 RepID=UPI0036266BDE